MNFTPRRNMVTVRLAPLETARPSGIAVVALNAAPSWRATVVACGPEVRDVRPGMRVIVSRLQGIEVGDVIVVPESAILAEERDA